MAACLRAVAAWVAWISKSNRSNEKEKRPGSDAGPFALDYAYKMRPQRRREGNCFSVTDNAKGGGNIPTMRPIPASSESFLRWGIKSSVEGLVPRPATIFF